jgi:hypothetical protein
LNGAAIPYLNPYTPTEPIPGLTLDPQTGLINFTLNQAGNWVVVVQVTQYDADGNVTGIIMRDMQFVAYPCSNIPPDAATGLVSNVTGAAVQTGPRAVEVCENGNFCFDMTISDPNQNNVLDAFSNVARGHLQLHRHQPDHRHGVLDGPSGHRGLLSVHRERG